MAQTTRQRLLAIACARLGKEFVAARLNTPVHLLDAWMSGHATMPDAKFNELANVIDESGIDPNEG
jgi:hypothetical protein